MTAKQEGKLERRVLRDRLEAGLSTGFAKIDRNPPF